MMTLKKKEDYFHSSLVMFMYVHMMEDTYSWGLHEDQHALRGKDERTKLHGCVRVRVIVV